MFTVHSDFSGSTKYQATDVDMAIVDMSFSLVELFDEQVENDDEDLMAHHGVDRSKFSADSLTLQVNEDLIAPQLSLTFRLIICPMNNLK